MKIDLSQKILGIDRIKAIPNLETKKDLTLKDVCISSVLSPNMETNPQTGERKDKDTDKEKYKKYDLYKKVNVEDKEVDFKVDEITFLKELIGRVENALVMGQAWDMLEKDK